MIIQDSWNPPQLSLLFDGVNDGLLWDVVADGWTGAVEVDGVLEGNEENLAQLLHQVSCVS